MAIKIQGDGGTTAEVSATDQALVVRVSPTASQAGHVIANAEASASTDPAGRTVRAMDVSADFRTRIGLDTSLMNTAFEGAVTWTPMFNQSLSTMTTSQGSGYLRLNAGSSVASGTYAILQSYRTFPLLGSYPLYFETWCRNINDAIANAVTEFGFGYAATMAAPTDGAYFRVNATGDWLAVVNYGGTERTSTMSRPTTSQNHHFLIVLHNDSAEFWIDGALQARIAVSVDAPSMVSSSHQQAFFRVYNSGVPSSARQLDIGFLNVSLGDALSGKPWSHVCAGTGGTAVQFQNGSTVGPTVTRGTGANGWPTSATARAAGTWTATSAPALNSLGGLWSSPAISTLTSDADYPVFAFQNPAGNNARPGKTLYVTGVRCGEAYASAAASTNAIFLSCIVAVGGTASATSTADAATTVAPKAVVVGGYGFVATDVIGATRAGFDISFDSPLIVPPGAYFHFIVRPVGTVTSNTLTVHSSLAVHGYFE